MSESSNQLSLACESCYQRKVKCISDSSSAACTACIANGGECVARYKQRLGRPKGSRKHSWKLPHAKRNSVSGQQRMNHDVFTGHAQMDIFDVTPVQTNNEQPGTAEESALIASRSTTTSQDAQLALVVFQMHCRVQGIEANYLTGLTEDRETAVKVIEELGDLIKTLTSDDAGSSSLAWTPYDPTLLLLFVTVARAVNICENLFQASLSFASPATQSSSSLSGVSMIDPFEDFCLWQDTDAHFNASWETALGLTSTSFPELDFSNLAMFTQQDSKTETLALTRFDMILYDLSRFARRMVEMLDHSSNDHMTTSSAVDKLQSENVQCLTTLTRLHLQLRGQIDNIKPEW